MRLLLGALAATALTLLAPAGPAAANSYGPVSGDAKVSATVVTEGGSVTVSGSGFCPGTTVDVAVQTDGETYQTDQVEADGQGKVSVRITPTRTGRHTVTLTGETDECDGTDQVLGVKFTVRPAAAAGAQGPRAVNSALADTGGVDMTPLWVGLSLLISGALLVGVARNRQRTTV